MTNIDKLCEVTGVKRPVLDEIWQQVKDNQATLKSCAVPHDFSICLDRRTKQPVENPTPAQRFGCHWKCSKCGGVVDTLRKLAYEDGLRDAKNT